MTTAPDWFGANLRSHNVESEYAVPDRKSSSMLSQQARHLTILKEKPNFWLDPDGSLRVKRSPLRKLGLFSFHLRLSQDGVVRCDILR